MNAYRTLAYGVSLFLGLIRRQRAIRALILIAELFTTASAFATGNRSTYIDYGLGGNNGFNIMALDTAHQQVFTAWWNLNRVDVLSTVDYHLIQSIITPSPTTIDISPDSSTVAVGNSFSTVTFYSTINYAQTAQFVLPQMGNGITSLVYTANSDLIVVGRDQSSNGISAYWNHLENQVENYSTRDGLPTTYVTAISPFGAALLARSTDYSRIMIGQTDEQAVQIIDGATGNPLYTWNPNDWQTTAIAASNGGNRYAICAAPVGFTPWLHILDATFNEVNDQAGYAPCTGMIFSPDGTKLWGDSYVNGVYSTAALDMNTFQMTSVPNYFTPQPLNIPPAFWQAMDSTGMLYGEYAQDATGQKVWVALDTAAGTAPTPPSGQTPVTIAQVLDNIGSPQGGDTIHILCTGLLNVPESAIQVMIGGKAAQVTGVLDPTGPETTAPAYQMVTVTTPPGAPGLANVTLQALGTSYASAQSFQYAQSRTIYPFSVSPTYLAYNATTQLLYASHGNQVEVIDAVHQRVLSPLVPASGKLTNSQFAGLSISLDGGRLWVADKGANLIHMISLSSPGTGYSINPTTVLGSGTPVSPLRVYEMADGKLLGSNGQLFQIDPGAMSGNWVSDSTGNPMSGYLWGTTNAGNNAVFVGYGTTGVWNVNTGLNMMQEFSYGELFYILPAWGQFETAANEDGTIMGGSSSMSWFMDFNFNLLGYLLEEPSINTFGNSLVLHPSGALYYQLENPLSGNNWPGVVDIADTHQWRRAAGVVFPEMFATADGSTWNSINAQQQLAVDPTGQYIFGVTASGITQIVLNNLPLSIGNVQPAFVQAPGTQQITVRGSGFQPRSSVSFGGVAVATSYVDSNTLTATPPSLVSGWTDVTVTLPGGASYTAPALLHVLAQITTPNITGSSPANLLLATPPTWGTGITGTSAVTLTGTGFDISNTVIANGVPFLSAFIDANHIQAQFYSAFTNQTGSIAFTVTSSYTGASNTYLVPVVNPVPVIQKTIPAALPLDGPDITVKVMGTGLVNGPTAQFSGQNVQASFGPGAFDEVVIPASMLATAGTATLILTNPGPGGGQSNPFNIQISASAPLAKVQLTASATTIPSYQSVTMTATVTGNGASPIGQLVLMDGSTMLNAETLPSNDTATFIIGPLSLGQHNITAGYGGDTTYAPAVSAAVPVNVVAVATPTVTVTPSQSSVTTSQPLTVSLTVAGNATNPVPTGTVTLIGDGYNGPATALQSGSASFNIPAGTLAAGMAYLSAYYIPDASSSSVFGPSSGSATVTVSAVKVSYSLSASNISVARGASGTSTVTVTSANGYAGVVTLTCSVTSSPAGATDLPGCSPGSAVTLSANAPTVSTSMAITTTAPSSAFATRPAFRVLGELGTIALAGILIWPRKRNLRRWLRLLSAIGVAFLISSCGGGGGGQGGLPSNPGTTLGTYTVTINATGNDSPQTTAKATFTLTVN